VVGILERKVIPSDATDQVYYSKANEFAGVNNTYEKFNAAIEDQKLSVYVRTVTGFNLLTVRLQDSNIPDTG